MKLSKSVALLAACSALLLAAVSTGAGPTALSCEKLCGTLADEGCDGDTCLSECEYAESIAPMADCSAELETFNACQIEDRDSCGAPCDAQHDAFLSCIGFDD